MSDQFEEFQETMSKKFSSLRENVFVFNYLLYFSSYQIQKMHKSFEEERSNREQLFDLKLKEVINIDQKFTQAMESEILVRCPKITSFSKNQARKEGENKILRIIDERVNLIKNEIVKESKTRAECIENINQCLEVKTKTHFF